MGADLKNPLPSCLYFGVHSVVTVVALQLGVWPLPASPYQSGIAPWAVGPAA
jgi:hypothetical protein